MNCSLWFSILLFFQFESSTTLKCNPKDNCSCYPGKDFEIQCPTEQEDLIIRIKEKEEILIDCPYPIQLQRFNVNELPNITIDKIENFRLRFCPLPEIPFQKIIEWFSLTRITSFEFSLSNTKESWTQDSFKGFEEVQDLRLYENGIRDFDENVFLHAPNLVSLDLNNNNITLKANLFKNVPLLQFLDLSGNGLENLPPGVFQPLKSLQILHLWKNKLTKLYQFTFTGLVSLESLELSSNQIEEIPKNAFKGLRNLRRINLSANKIKKVPPDLFKNNKKLKLVKMRNCSLELQLPDYFFANLSLTQVDLTDCHLETLPGHVFENSSALRVIKLGKNLLRFLPEGIFEGLVNLKHIRLQNNKIESISQVFKGLKQLKSLSLQNNALSVLPGEVFADLINLEMIGLQRNKISRVEARLFANNKQLAIINLSHNIIVTPLDEIIALDGAPNLQHLDLSHNHIANIKLANLKPVSNVTLKLDHNHVSVVDFQFQNGGSSILRISLNKNPIWCDCRNYDFLEYVKTEQKGSVKFGVKNVRCANPPQLKNVSVLTLPSALHCPLQNYTQCPNKCSCAWRPADNSLVINCSEKKLTTFPEIDLSQVDFVKFNQTEVHLEGNDITVLSYLNGYENVSKLFLSGNKIRTITWLPPKLEVLHLDHNHISDLNQEIVETLNNSRLVELTLHGNPWVCDCGSEVLAGFLRQTKTIGRTDIFCVETNQRLIDVNQADLCYNRKALYFILVLSLLLVLTILAALYYRHRERIKIWLFAQNLCLCLVTEEELDKDKIYDVFISYSHKDEHFVVQNLLPLLETYKLCLHYRNWIPGEPITTQITNSVLQSRRTLVVLSKNFLESDWGIMEFRTAHTQAMSDGRARVLLVMYGDVDTLDQELKMYLKTNTYVKWGDPHFCDKLKFALPHRLRREVNVNDDESRLIGSAPSPGSSSPIGSKDPFNFLGVCTKGDVASRTWQQM